MYWSLPEKSPIKPPASLTISAPAAISHELRPISQNPSSLPAGRLDGFWEIGLNSWDIAAGALMVKEAGGFIGDFSGRDQYMETGNIVAGNAEVYKELLKKIHPHLTEDLQR